ASAKAESPALQLRVNGLSGDLGDGCAEYLTRSDALKPRHGLQPVRSPSPPDLQLRFHHAGVGRERTESLHLPGDRDMVQRAAAVLSALDDRAHVVLSDGDKDLDFLCVRRS